MIQSGQTTRALVFRSDPFNKRRAWVNIQHPATDVDRTIEITTGED